MHLEGLFYRNGATLSIKHPPCQHSDNSALIRSVFILNQRSKDTPTLLLLQFLQTHHRVVCLMKLENWSAQSLITARVSLPPSTSLTPRLTRSLPVSHHRPHLPLLLTPRLSSPPASPSPPHSPSLITARVSLSSSPPSLITSRVTLSFQRSFPPRLTRVPLLHTFLRFPSQLRLALLLDPPILHPENAESIPAL